MRLIAATNADIEALVRRGDFREDLYYRLNVITLQLPPLRDRTEDIPLLARHFLRVYAEENGKAMQSISPAALELLMDYRWPGNVRELENAIERAVVLSSGEVLEVELLPPAVRSGAGGGNGTGLLPPPAVRSRERLVLGRRLGLRASAGHRGAAVRRRGAEEGGRAAADQADHTARDDETARRDRRSAGLLRPGRRRLFQRNILHSKDFMVALCGRGRNRLELAVRARCPRASVPSQEGVA